MNEKFKKRMEELGISPKTQTTDNNAQESGLSKFEKRMGSLGIQPVAKTSSAEDDIDSFLQDSKIFAENGSKLGDTISFSTASSIYENRKKAADDLLKRGSAISLYLDKNKDTFSPAYYKSVKEYLTNFSDYAKENVRKLQSARDYYSKFESEKKQLEYEASQEEYQKMSSLDQDAEQKDIAYLETVRKEYSDLLAKQNEAPTYLRGGYRDISDPYKKTQDAPQTDIPKEERLDQLSEEYGSLKDLDNLINEKRAFLKRAEHVQEGILLSSVVENDDFQDYSGYVSTESDDVWDTTYLRGGYRDISAPYKKTQDAPQEVRRSMDLTYEYINNQNGIRDEINEMYISNTAGNIVYKKSPFEEKGYDLLKEDEIAIYNYYYARYGKEKAQEYLDNLQETLNKRKATGMYEVMENNTAVEMVFGVAAGLDQFTSGMKNLFNTEDDYIAPSAYQMASAMVREDLADVGKKLPDWIGGSYDEEGNRTGASAGQVWYDVINTSANMAPSILTSMAVGMINPVAGQWVGSSLLGASAAGNAYQEALNEGYSKDQARGYSVLVGASEAVMEKVLGGISSFGGNPVGKLFTKAFGEADNVLKAIAKNLGGSVLSEFSEEYLQEVLTPVFQNLALGKDEDVKLFSAEALYAGILGALTAGVMEGPTTIAGEVKTNRTGKQLQKAGVTAQRLAEIGNTFAADTVAHQLAGKVNENTGAYTMGRLFNEIGATLTEQNVNDITNALVKDGMSEKLARKNAQIMARVIEGENLSDLQVAAIEGNDILAKAVRTTIIDSNATWFQRTNGYKEALMALAQEQAASKTASKEKAAPGQENAPAADMVDGETENGAESLAGVDTSPEKVKRISAIQNGKATVKLENDSEVSVREADLDPDEGVRIETIAGIEGISVEDANSVLGILKTELGASAQVDSLGAKEAYKYGFYGFSQDHIAKHGVFANSLSESQRQAIYEIGKRARQKQIDSAAPKTAVQQTGIYFDAGGGNVMSFSEAKKAGLFEKKTGLSEEQTAGVQAAMVLRKLGIGGSIYFFESYRNSNNQLVYKDKHGKEVNAPNGWYSEKDGSIHIDLNAGARGQGYVLFTLAHELTHFIEQWSPKKYKVLADFLVENYENGQSMNSLVLKKQKRLSELRGKEVSYDEAYSEVIADSMEAMLADGNVLEKLVELKAKDQGLVAKMKQFFDNLAAKIRNIYKNLKPDSAEGKAVLKMKDSIEKIQQLFADALVEASENFQTAMDSVVETDAEAVADSEILTDGAVVTDGEGKKYSIKSMKHDIAEGQMFEDLKTYCGWTQKQVNELRKNLKDLVEYMTPYRDILDMNETYDREGRRFSPYKPNSDPLYKISMDFSTLCSKRLLTQYVIENFQLRENRPMSAEEQMAIRDMLNEYRKVEKGLQVACAMCYVEAARLKSPKQISKWMADPETQMKNYFADKNPEFSAYIKEKQADFKESRGYARNATKKDMSAKDVRELNKIRPRLRSQYKVNAEEAKIIERAKTLPNSTYLTAANLANLSETDPTIYSAYTAFVRTATRSKSLETDEPYYYGDSRRDNGNGIVVTDSFIESVNRENGMRFSSWSDWRIQHLLDYITAVIDNSVRGAAMHGYTKFAEEVRVLGKTGMMFNMSGVAGTQTGLNEDGSLSFSPTESMDVNEAIKLREEFPDTAGLQCIGVSDEHIVSLLRSDIIDYVIPYHVSGLNAALRRMANIFGWDDYTTTQHAAIDKSIKYEDAVDKEHWHEEPVYSEFFVGYDTGMTGIEAMRASADRYVQMCKDRGLKPKFEKFLKEENYWKLLIDRKMINQKTGRLIQQKAVTPTFDFDAIKGIVDQYVKNYDSNLEARALNHIVENWDSIPKRIRDLKKQGGAKAKKASKAVDNLANETLAAQPTKLSDRYWYPNMTKTEIAEVSAIAKEEARKTGNYLCIDSKWLYNNKKGHRYFALYSTQREEITLLYACKGDSAEYEHELLKDIIEQEGGLNEHIDTGPTTISKIFSRTANAKNLKAANRSGTVGTGGNNGNAAVHSRYPRKRPSKAFINCLKNIEKVQQQYGVDDHYLFAIDLGDYVTAQRMVDEAAEKAGYTTKGYHGSRTPGFTVVDKYSWLWLARDEAVANVFGTRTEADNKGKPHNKNGVYAMRYNLGKNLVINADGNSWGELPVTEDEYPGVYTDEETGDITTDAMAEWAARNGYDSITFIDVDDGGITTVDVVFNPNKDAKSADPITYDDNGNVIPLSKRFKQENNDIRYSDRDFPDNAEDVAREYFGITRKWSETGWLLRDGTQLDFSGRHWERDPENEIDLGESYYSGKRNMEHYEIAEAFPELRDFNSMEYRGEHLDRFLNRGNIRIAGKGIVAIEKMPTEEQFEKLRSYFRENNDKYIVVGIGRDGLNFNAGTNPLIINEAIRDYFSHNRRNQSELMRFHTMFSDRDTESVSNRSLLANAFEGVVKDSEKQKLQEYRDMISVIEAEEQKLRELRGKIKKLSFAKGPRDTKAIRSLQFEANQTANRISTYDKQLLRLEAAKPLQDVLAREKELVRKREQKRTKEAMESYRLKAEVKQSEILRDYRETRAALRQQESDTAVIEKEFIRIAKAYEKLDAKTTAKIGKDTKTIADLKAALKEETQKHRSDQKTWEAEFNRLLREYEAADRSIDRLQEKVERQQHMAKKRVDDRKKTAVRQKVRKVIRDLDKLLNRGDKKKNVKEDMKDLVAEALASAEILFTDNYSNEDMIRNGVGTDLTPEEAKYLEEARAIMEQIYNLPSGSYEAMLSRQETEETLKSRLGYRMNKLKDVFLRERARLNKAQVSDVLGKLADAYKSLESSEHSYVKDAFHDNVYQYLLLLKEEVGGTTVKDMSLSQLEDLYKAYTMVLTTVRNANKMFASNLKETRDNLANRVMFEVRKAGGVHGKWSKLGKLNNAFSWNNEKPVYAFERIGSTTLSALYGNIRKGQDTWAVDMIEADSFRREMYKKYKRSGWDMKKQHKFTSSSGLEFSLNLDQIMSLYAYSKRDKAHEHLLRGGFVFDSNTEVVVSKHGIPITYMVEDANAYNVSMEILSDIVSNLTDEQKAFVDEMQDYLSSTMGDKGNSVSMELYGVKLFNEKFYFPLKSAGQYMERAKEANLKQEQGQINIVNSGFTNATTPKASNSVVLSGFMDVWAGHVNDMSMYHAFVLPMEDFRRVYNYSSPTRESESPVSVNAVIQNAYGTAATAYIDQLYRDLNGGAVSDPRENFSKALTGKFKKAAVMASLSVVFQQPSAIGRACAFIDPKHFGALPILRGTGRALTNLITHKHDQMWNELKKYAPVAMIKEMGYFDTGMGRSAKDYLQAEEYHGFKENIFGFLKDGDFRDEKLSAFAAKADELTWIQIWNAVKNETAERNPKMDRTSQEFLKLAGERFAEVIDKTQVYDSVLSRSANMRSKNLFMNMFTSFMAEPTTSINMLEEALRQGKKGNKKLAARMIGSVGLSVIINSALVSLVYAARDDDEDETWFEKYVSSFLVEIVDGINPVTYLPFYKDVWSLLQGYDIERADMSIISDFTKSLQGIVKAYAEDTTGMSAEKLAEHEKKIAQAWWGAADSITSLLGVPFKNLRREILGVFNLYSTIKKDFSVRDTSWGSLKVVVGGDLKDSVPILGWLPDDSKEERLYDAIISGDKVYAERLKSGYKDDKAVKSAIKSAIRKRYIAGDIDAKTARKHLTDYVGEKIDKTYWTVKEWNDTIENGSNDDYQKYGQLYDAVRTGKDLKNTIKEYTDNGVKQDTLRGQITEHFKPEYLKMSASERASIKGYLVNGYVMTGLPREKAMERIGEWDFEAKYGFAYEDRKQAYIDGKISASELKKAVMTTGGKTEAEADKYIADLEFEKANGYDWSDRASAYKSGEISAEELRQDLIEFGGYDPEEAAAQIEAYDWQAEGYEDVTAAAVRQYNAHCADSNVPKDIYLYIRTFSNNTENDVDQETGKTVYYSAMKKVIAEIDAQNLSAAQKTAIARSLGWADKNIAKYKTW